MKLNIGDLKEIALVSYKMGLKEKPKFELEMFLEQKILELKSLNKSRMSRFDFIFGAKLYNKTHAGKKNAINIKKKLEEIEG